MIIYKQIETKLIETEQDDINLHSFLRTRNEKELIAVIDWQEPSTRYVVGSVKDVAKIQKISRAIVKCVKEFDDVSQATELYIEMLLKGTLF